MDGSKLWFAFMGPLVVGLVICLLWLSPLVGLGMLVAVLVFGRLFLTLCNTMEQRGIDETAAEQSRSKRRRRGST